jgi:hypothetical protein
VLAPDRIEPRLAKDPIEKADSAEPMLPIDSTEPLEPIDRIDPFEPIDRIDPCDLYDHSDGVSRMRRSLAPEARGRHRAATQPANRSGRRPVGAMGHPGR